MLQAHLRHWTSAGRFEQGSGAHGHLIRTAADGGSWWHAVEQLPHLCPLAPSKQAPRVHPVYKVGEMKNSSILLNANHHTL